MSPFFQSLTVRPAFSDIWCGRRSVGVASWPLLPSHFGWHLFCRPLLSNKAQQGARPSKAQQGVSLYHCHNQGWMGIFRDAGSWKPADAHFDVPWIWWFHGSHWSGSKQLRLGLELDITWSILILLESYQHSFGQFWSILVQLRQSLGSFGLQEGEFDYFQRIETSVEHLAIWRHHGLLSAAASTKTGRTLPSSLETW